MDKETWDAIINRSYDLEFDWFGVDILGQIAVFSSFNRGFIPTKAISSLEKYIEFQNVIKALPKKTNVKLCAKNDGDFSDWISYSEKGLYSFDYQDAHRKIKTGCYDLIAKPRKPLSILNIENFKQYLEILPEFELIFDELEEKILFEELEKSQI